MLVSDLISCLEKGFYGCGMDELPDNFVLEIFGDDQIVRVKVFERVEG